jgi:uncharacterized membrane protein YqaE (UPF0057 family)
MKKINTRIRLIGVSAMALLLASCGSMNQSTFNKAKYYNFGHNDPVVSFNKIDHDAKKEVKTNVITPVPTTVIANNANTKSANVTASGTQPVKAIVTGQKKTNKQVQHKAIATVMNTIALAKAETKIKAIEAVSPDEIQNTNSTKGTHDIPLIVLIILALIIPPLAVYLHDDMLKTHFWVILILWLLGGGLAFGLVSGAGAFGLLWLIAAIWAIIIVTGSAGSI